MKLKLSRTSQLILGGGMFVVIAGSLGFSHSQQIKEQQHLDEELAIAESRLDKLQVNAMRDQEAELQAQVDESAAQVAEAKQNLLQPVESIDVTDEVFAIAMDCSVTVESLSASGIKPEKLDDTVYLSQSISGQVSGNALALIDFVTSLNNDFTTGVVRSAQLTINDMSLDNTSSTANLQMVVYTYDGE